MSCFALRLASSSLQLRGYCRNGRLGVQRSLAHAREVHLLRRSFAIPRSQDHPQEVLVRQQMNLSGDCIGGTGLPRPLAHQQASGRCLKHPQGLSPMTARIAAVSRGLSQLVEGRSDFFAELAQCVGFEAQLLAVCMLDRAQNNRRSSVCCATPCWVTQCH